MRNSFRVLIAMLAVITVALVWCGPMYKWNLRAVPTTPSRISGKYDFYTPETFEKMPTHFPKI